MPGGVRRIFHTVRETQKEKTQHTNIYTAPTGKTRTRENRDSILLTRTCDTADPSCHSMSPRLPVLVVCASGMAMGLRASNPPGMLHRRAMPRMMSADANIDVAKPEAPPPTVAPFRWSHMAEYADGGLTPARIRVDDKVHYGLINSESNQRIDLGPAAPWDRLRVGFFFGLWYVLSIVYSVKNKQAHLLLALPNTIATAQLVVGAIMGGLLWTSRLRTPPKLSLAAFRTLLPIGLFHAIGHLTGVYATAVGSVSFVQVVKSAGPVYAALISGLLLRQRVSARVWLSLLPIVGGVGLASAKELEFVWAAFLGAAASDVALALRNVLSKKSMDKPQAGNMTPANTFYLFTCLSCLFCVPLSAALEWAGAAAAWSAATPTPAAAAGLIGLIVQSGLYFTLYSEVQFKALDSVHPVTHAVGNTMRRVVIMLVCIAFFQTPVSLLGGIGSAIAIVGSYLYAMAKTREQELAKQAATAANPGAADDELTSGKQDHPLLPLIKALGHASEKYARLRSA